MAIILEDFKESDFERCLEIRIQNYKEVNKIAYDETEVRDFFLSRLKNRICWILLRNAQMAKVSQIFVMKKFVWSGIIEYFSWFLV